MQTPELDDLSLEEQNRHLRAMCMRMTAVHPDAEVTVQDGEVKFQPAEVRILGLLTQRAGEAVPTAALLAAINWHRPNARPGDQIVRQYVHHIKRSLAVLGLADRLQVVRGVGYRWQPRIARDDDESRPLRVPVGPLPAGGDTAGGAPPASPAFQNGGR